jgi:hypothetical protein
MTITDPRLARETTRVPRRSDYVKRPVLSATIHPDLKRTLVAMSERTGMSVSQVTDEVLYTGLVEMQELPELDELSEERLQGLTCIWIQHTRAEELSQKRIGNSLMHGIKVTLLMSGNVKEQRGLRIFKETGMKL